MNIRESYQWEAETGSGNIISEGADLRGCGRVSLIPKDPASGLPAHHFTGLPFENRFCRGFNKITFNPKEDLPGVIFWQDGESVLRTSEALTGCLSPGDLVGKGVAGDEFYRVLRVDPDKIYIAKPYRGITKVNGLVGRRISGRAGLESFHYFHCIVCVDFKIWVNCRDGSILISPKDYDLYI